MCGIFGFLGKEDNYDFEILKSNFNKIINRGPDNSQLIQITNNLSQDLIFGFHRLSINDLTDGGNQPMKLHDCYLICNGEIYNYKELRDKFEFDYQSNSDCEIILHMYKKFGIEETLKNLDGYFAFLLYDFNLNVLYAARDPFGVRPLFISSDCNNNIFFSSEIKAVNVLCNKIDIFPPGTFWSNNSRNEFHKYYHYDYPIDNCCFDVTNNSKSINIEFNQDIILKNIRDLFTNAVSKRLMSDRPIGCLLSGGLDSSLVSSLVAREFKKNKKGTINTFSIGMPGSTDLHYAKKVADYIGSVHHHIELSPQQFLDAIPEVIYHIESYDTTTVRASVGNYLVAKYIKENTDCTVIYNGDGSDEQSGYLYLRNAPSPEDFQLECIKLLKEIHMFDVLRSDRSISSNWSLESRTPFLDQKFVQYYMSIDPRLKMYNKDRIEKYLLRKAFEDEHLLPPEVLWRPKEAFSDGCSSKENSWHNVIQNYVDSKISDEELEQAKNIYTHNTPVLKESLYYRNIFEKHYKNNAHLIKHFWMPKWCGNQSDPSARVLNIYTNDIEKNTTNNRTCNIV